MRSSIVFRGVFASLLAVGMCVLLGCSEDGTTIAPADDTGTLDTVAPLSPIPSTAEQARGAISVEWLANSEPDVVGYNVYAYHPDPTRGSAYEKVNDTPVGSAQYFTDVTESVQWIRLSAVDGAGNESALSAPIQITITDAGGIEGDSEIRPVDVN